MSYIERRRNLFYATLVIPPDVRERLGKFKFIQSLGTPDKRKAEALAAPVVAKWKAIIRRERGEGDALVNEALKWREVLAEIPAENDAGLDATTDAIVAKAERIEAQKGYAHAKRFADIAFGDATPSDAFYAEWSAQLKLSEKTMDQMRKDVTALLAHFPTLQEISHQSVKRWLDKLSKEGTSPISQARIASCCRNYWGYLQHRDAVPSDSEPFSRLAKGGSKRKAAGGSWEPLAAKEVVKLWKAAREGNDAVLADLVQLGAYSGARIEELCALKVTHVSVSSFRIVDAKTSAGIREVPIHSAIAPLVKRLKKASTDGYLLSGLTFNKYGDRSNAIGKRFGRLKSGLGFGPRHVFHSIRKTLVTLLENKGVSENLAADIVGHEKPRITYGLYSGGATLAVKAKALELVAYPVK